MKPRIKWGIWGGRGWRFFPVSFYNTEWTYQYAAELNRLNPDMTG